MKKSKVILGTVYSKNQTVVENVIEITKEINMLKFIKEDGGWVVFKYEDVYFYEVIPQEEK